MSDSWVPIIVAGLMGGGATALVQFLNARRADKRTEDEGENKADDQRIGRIYEGFDAILHRGEAALAKCEEQLNTCTESAGRLGDTVGKLQDRVREATSLMDAHIAHLQEEKRDGD